MIRLEQIGLAFRRGAVRHEVLGSVTCTLPDVPGLAILGRNGVGKSTLMRLIAGTLKPDRGRVVTDERVSWPMGFAGGLHPALTGGQNARFVARVYGCDVGRLAANVRAFSELGEAWTRPVAAYSTGMKARLAFAISMEIAFDTYLVDEIIGVGDAAFRRKCAARFRNRLASARVIMISHNPDTLRQFCQAGLVLEGGRLTHHADIEQAIAAHDANLERTMAVGA